VREVVEGEVAGSDAHAGEIEPPRRCVGNKAGEIALGDQLGDARADDERVENVVEALAVEPLWRGQ
jgi:hypothetical protein